jgi:hypothetical protein
VTCGAVDTFSRIPAGELGADGIRVIVEDMLAQGRSPALC